MKFIIKIILLVTCIQTICVVLKAQFVLSGTVFDSSKTNYVPGVKVMNKAGHFTYTDSIGRYSLNVVDNDAITLTFNDKSTQQFFVQTAADVSHFDICLKIPYKGKYHTLKEVVVFTKSYKEDSIENREEYAKILNYQKPGIKTSIVPGGGVGMDADELINMFRFKRNKRIKAFQIRLQDEEKEKYITYRFNKIVVKKITHLDGEQLDMFLIKYRPSYDFVSTADDLSLNQYILNCSYSFKLEMLQNTGVQKNL